MQGKVGKKELKEQIEQALAVQHDEVLGEQPGEISFKQAKI